MALIIEDGRCPAFANSYVSLEDADSYLVGRGIWPATPMLEPDETPDLLEEGETAGENEAAEAIPDAAMLAKKEAALVRAFDFLNTLKWKGKKPCWERAAAWPRENVPIPCLTPVEYIDPDLIPQAVIQAQCELGGLIYNGYGPFAPVEHGGKVKAVSDSESKGLDVLSKSKSHSVTYAEDAPVETWLPSVYPLLAPFLEEIPGQAKSGFTVHDVLLG